MSALVNTIGITLGLGVLGLGGWGVVVFLNKEPKAYTLNSDEGKDSAKSYTANTTIGGIEANKQVLVADIKKNEAWFKWSFKSQLNPMKEGKEKDNMDSEFVNIIEGYGTDLTKSLNKVCDTFYKKPNTDLSTDNKKKNSVKWFCSIDRDKDIVTNITN